MQCKFYNLVSFNIDLVLSMCVCVCVCIVFIVFTNIIIVVSRCNS